MGTEEVIEFLMYTETISITEKWQIFEYMLDTSNAEQKELLYNMVDEYKLRRNKNGNV